MSNIDKYAQFITQQKEKNDFGYPAQISEQKLRVHFNNVGDKTFDPIEITRKPKSWQTNENIVGYAKSHEEVRSIMNSHGTSVKKVEVA